MPPTTRIEPKSSRASRVLASLLAGAILHFAPAAGYAADPSTPEAEPAYGEELEGFDYPFPLHRFFFDSQGQSMQMAYLDVAPQRANGRVVVLLHGKNFCAATWAGTIRALADSGYRVVAPDQIGFCKSTKPRRYQYTFQQLARNTHALLGYLGIDTVTVMGHSTGGMLATRFALMYPRMTRQLVMVNPIGLEDWKAKGVPSLSVDQWYERDLNTTAERIRNYERATYYAGQWRPEYEPWVQMLAGLYRGPGKEIVAWNSALIYDMIYTQPVLYEFGQLKMPVLLLMGQQDTTAIGKDLSPPEVKATLGNYPELGRLTAHAIPQATLVEFPDLGHAPQIQDPVAFHAALIEGLKAAVR